ATTKRSRRADGCVVEYNGDSTPRRFLARRLPMRYSLLFLIALAAPVAAQPAKLPKVVLVGDSGAKEAAPLVADQFKGQATVDYLDATDPQAVLGEEPTVVYIHGKVKFDQHRLPLDDKHAVVYAMSAANPELQKSLNTFGVVVHDLAALGKADKARTAESVADVIRRQLTVMGTVPFRPVPGGPDAGEEYRKAEAERDAQVPEWFRKLKAAEFTVPRDAAAWEKERPALRQKVIASLGDLPPRPKTQKVRIVSTELRKGYRLEKFAIDNEVGNE